MTLPSRPFPGAGDRAAVTTVLHSARLIDGGVTDDAWVAFDGGAVAASGTGGSWERLRPADAVDLGGAFLAPGFIDLHGHGGGGASYDDGADAIRSARATHRRHGTTRAVISLVTASIHDLAARVAVVAELAAHDETILGSHLEGPFLDPGHKGAHAEGLLRRADPVTIDRLLAAGRGTIRQVTVAPEQPGGLDAVRRLAAAGVTVAVGHTDATAEQSATAFDAGAALLTHAFNAMPGIHHRAPGPVVAAMRDERVTLEIIADGTHVHPDVVALAFAGAPGRVALITDAMAAAAADDGAYELGELSVTVEGGIARLADGTIAGSTLTQDVALRNAVTWGIDLPRAVAALTRVPARALGLHERLGGLRAGMAADAVVLDESLNVVAVWSCGVR